MTRLRPGWVQPPLFDAPRDLSRASSQLPPLDPGLARRAHAEAGRLAGMRGWSPRTLSLTQRGLRILLSVHAPGEPVRASTVRQLTARNMPFPHITHVLAATGMLDDDRPDTLAAWLDGQLAGLPPQIRDELDAWLSLRRNGGPRRRPRSRRTIVRDISSIRTFLTDAGTGYSTLRQITPDDITAWLAGRPGRSRPQDASTLRSLFSTLKAERLIFANPARSIHVSRRNPSVPAPLPANLIATAAAAAKDDPALRAVVALAAVHALLPGQIRSLRLDQVDLPGRRLDPGGLDHPLDEFTVSAIRGYLDFRNQRWPATTSPYLLVTRKTAHTGDAVSRFWLNRLFRGLPVTAGQLRDDRIVEEALARRSDPLHLAAVFGFGPRTGLRYAAAARDSAEPPVAIS
jgi:integrase